MIATQKQIEYIRLLEKELRINPRRYRNLRVWEANKIIERLKNKTKQTTLNLEA